MPDITPGKAAYAVYADYHKRPEGHVAFEDLSEFSKGFWTAVADAAVKAAHGRVPDYVRVLMDASEQDLTDALAILGRPSRTKLRAFLDGDDDGR